jgi:signal transduction histidine kinase
LPAVHSDATLLSQVFINLIENALKYHKPGEPPRIAIDWTKENHSVIVRVSDQGIGIPEEVLPHIFDPFYTTKPIGKGTGLGLNISHNIIVHKHKGQIEVNSQPGKTIFTVRLPRNSSPVDVENTLTKRENHV